MIVRAKNDTLTSEDIDETFISSNLSTHPFGDPDLIIRTSGEQRLSNFLLWEAAYAEFYFTKVLWPDFDEDDFNKALESYGCRDRRFGSVKSAPSTEEIRCEN